jgi:hypothetical protein
MTLRLHLPRPREPESVMVAGMGVASAAMPDTSIGPVPEQQPARWQYDFDPVTGQSRASYGGISTTSVPDTVTGDFTVQHDATGNNAILFRPDAPEEIASGGWQMNSQMVANINGGVAAGVYANLLTGTAIQAAPNLFIWGHLNILDYHGSGGNGQHVANYNQAIRRTTNAGGAPNNPSLWGAVFEVIDYGNTPTGTVGGSMNGIEIDMTCGNTDNAKLRRGIGIYVNKANAGDVAPTVDIGLHMAGITGSFNSGVRLEAGYNTAAIDLLTASRNSGAHTVWLGTGGDVAFDTTGTHNLFWDTATLGGVFHFAGGLRLEGALTLPALTNAANDAAAATAGVAVNQFYRNGSVVMQRIV